MNTKTFKEWYEEYWDTVTKHPTMYEAQLDAYLAGREIQRQEDKEKYEYNQSQKPDNN